VAQYDDKAGIEEFHIQCSDWWKDLAEKEREKFSSDWWENLAEKEKSSKVWPSGRMRSLFGHLETEGSGDDDVDKKRRVMLTRGTSQRCPTIGRSPLQVDGWEDLQDQDNGTRANRLSKECNGDTRTG
jgi:hypothetical protein